MLHFAHRFLDDEGGATAIEYALVASGIFLAIVSVLTQVGANLSGVFAQVNTGL